MRTSAFNIQGINNQKCVLANYLEMNDDDIAIVERSTTDGIHHYSVNDKQYFVAHASQQLAGDKLHTYNGSLWHILPVDDEQPYVRFTDQKVSEQLKSVTPSGHTLLGINQKKQIVIFDDENGFLVAWSYSAHIPEDISTYYLKGRTGSTLKQIMGNS